MNTKQLVALWYAVLVVILSLLARGWGIKGLETNGSAQVAIAAIIFGGLVIFTLKSSIQFDKKLFLKWMSAPAILLIALAILIFYDESHREVRKERGIEVLPPTAQARVTGNAGLSYGGTLFQGKLYNGTNYDLRNIVITITAKEKNGGTRWSRQFTDDVFIKPLTTGSFQIEVVGADGAELDWNIAEIKGENQER